MLGFREFRRNPPRVLVRAILSRFVRSSTTVTAALGTPASATSVTAPAIVPIACARSRSTGATRHVNTRTPAMGLFTLSPSARTLALQVNRTMTAGITTHDKRIHTVMTFASYDSRDAQIV